MAGQSFSLDGKVSEKGYVKMTNRKFFISKLLIALTIFLTLAFSFFQSVASPVPGAGSSLLTNPDYGYFFTKYGFQLHRADTQWVLDEVPSTDAATSTTDTRSNLQANLQSAIRTDLQVEFKPRESNTDTRLMIKRDDLQTPMNALTYGRRHIKEFQNFGFEVLGSQTFAQNQEQGFVVDFVNRKNAKQFRQVVFTNDKEAVILTCSGALATFKSGLASCNSIIRTFSWDKTNPQTDALKTQ